MNNKNKILVGCLALLLVLSVGYALFSETIEINGTATAKGNFNIDATCELVTESNKSNDNSYTMGGTGKCEIVNGVIKTTSTLNKPGDRVLYRITLKNTGTIPALLKTVNSSNNKILDRTASGDEVYYDSTYELYGLYIFEKYANGSSMGDSEVEALKITLDSNDTETLVIAHMWYDVKNQPSLPTDGVTMNYNMTLGFEQVAN